MVGGIGGPVGGFGGAHARPAEAKLSKHENVDRGDIVDHYSIFSLKSAIMLVRTRRRGDYVLIVLSGTFPCRLDTPA